MSHLTNDQQAEFVEQQKAHIVLTSVLMQDKAQRHQEAQIQFRDNWKRIMKGERIR